MSMATSFCLYIYLFLVPSFVFSFSAGSGEKEAGHRAKAQLWDVKSVYNHSLEDVFLLIDNCPYQ